MRVLICPDKFRGTMTARQAAEAMAAGWLAARPADEVEVVPLADGGEGTLEALTGGGSVVHTQVTGPLGDRIDAPFGLLPDGASVIESARAAGLALLAHDRRRPLRTTTRGVGDLMRAALDAGSQRLLVTLGGSATNDGGAGMASALGVRLLDGGGGRIREGGAGLVALAAIDLTAMDPRIASVDVVGLTDVDNPLCGPSGASATYGPQKGASPADVVLLDRALGHLAAVVRRDLGVELADEPGAGAAGGLGFGLLAFCGAHLRSGVQAVGEAVELERRLERVDLALTGEGALDATSLQGKVVGHVLGAAMLLRTPVAVICGRAAVTVDDATVRSLVEEVGEDAALRDARSATRKVSSALAHELGSDRTQGRR